MIDRRTSHENSCKFVDAHFFINSYQRSPLSPLSMAIFYETPCMPRKIKERDRLDMVVEQRVQYCKEKHLKSLNIYKTFLRCIIAEKELKFFRIVHLENTFRESGFFK